MVGSVGFIPPLAFTALTSSRRVVAVAARVADPPCSRLKGSTTHHSPQLLQVRGSLELSSLSLTIFAATTAPSSGRAENRWLMGAFYIADSGISSDFIIILQLATGCID